MFKFHQSKALLIYIIVLLLVGCAGSKKNGRQGAKDRHRNKNCPQLLGRSIQVGRHLSPVRYGLFRPVSSNRFSRSNMTIPRTSAEQSKMGKTIRLEEVKEGDLVFFAAGKKKRKITHVGLVTAVRNKDDVRFIHASSSKGVVEVNLLSRYYKKIFIKAVRPNI